MAAARAKETANDASEAEATAVKASATPGAAPSSPQEQVANAKKIIPRAAARHKARGLGAWNTPLAIAWSMPVHERSTEDAVAAAKAATIARAEKVVDEQMEADLNNS